MFALLDETTFTVCENSPNIPPYVLNDCDSFQLLLNTIFEGFPLLKIGEYYFNSLPEKIKVLVRKYQSVTILSMNSYYKIFLCVAMEDLRTNDGVKSPKYGFH